MYWALGEDDAIVIAEFPDAETAAAVSLRTSSTGAARVKTTRLLTASEVDAALERLTALAARTR